MSISISSEHMSNSFPCKIFHHGNIIRSEDRKSKVKISSSGRRDRGTGFSKVNLSTPRSEDRGLPSTRAQAEGLKVHPEPRFPTPPLKAELGAVERVNNFDRV